MTEDWPLGAGNAAERAADDAPERVQVEVAPVTGEEVVRWLERAAWAGLEGAISLSWFESGRASLSIEQAALGRLGEVLGGRVTALPRRLVEAGVPGPTGEPEQLDPPRPATEPDPDDDGEAAEPAIRRRLRVPWTAAIAVMVCAIAGLIPVLFVTRGGDLTEVFAPAGGQAPATVNRPAGTRPPAAALRRVERSLEGTCLPAAGEALCTPLREALWQGDLEAWRAWSAARGEPAPTAAEVTGRAIEFRLAAGDPAVRANLARASRQPLPLIGAVTLRDPESNLPRLDGVEIVNAGGAAADLSGVRVEGVGRITEGFSLGVGQRCAVGSLAVGPACPFIADDRAPAARDGSALRLVGPDGRVLDSLAVPR